MSTGAAKASSTRLLELDLQVAVSCPMWVLGTKLTDISSEDRSCLLVLLCRPREVS